MFDGARTHASKPGHIHGCYIVGLVSVPGISSVSSSTIVQDDTTGSVNLDTVTTSIGRVVLSGPDPDASSVGPTIEDVTGQE